MSKLVFKFNVHVYVYIPNDRSENEKARRKTFDYIYSLLNKVKGIV